MKNCDGNTGLIRRKCGTHWPAVHDSDLSKRVIVKVSMYIQRWEELLKAGALSFSLFIKKLVTR